MSVPVITTQLELAITYSRLARESDNEAKVAIHQANARKAYDTVLHFLATSALSQAEEIELVKKLALLKSSLLELGEKF